MEKFGFAICYNNEQYLQECISYIKKIHVPENIEIDIGKKKECEGDENTGGKVRKKLMEI